MRSRATALVLGAARALSAKHGRASTWPTMQPANEVGYASFNYCAPDVTAVSTRRDGAGSDGELEGAAWSPTVVRIHDGRERPWSLEKNGFRLVEAPIDADLDLYDDAAVTGRYYGMCEALVAEQCPGATVVKAFDHNVRCEEGKASGRKLKGGSNVQAPAGLVHGDYTAVSAPRRLAQLSEAPKTNDALNKPPLDGVDATGRRFAFINVWRPISTVQSTPLACCDASSVSEDELLTFQIHYSDRVGENYFARHHERHAWYYFPRMRREEALLIQQWDSADDAAKFALHSAFSDPSSPSDAPARESIEVRLVVVY